MNSISCSGIGRSSRIGIFDGQVERALYGVFDSVTELEFSPDGVPRHLAVSQMRGELALERTGAVLAHINTDHTARDMLRITEAYGYEKLQYWGFSCAIFLHPSAYLTILQIWIRPWCNVRGHVPG